MFLKHLNISILYGFGDPHINQIIAEAVTDHGLRVYLITTSSMDTIKKNLGEEYIPTILYKGLQAYYQYRLGEIYPYDQGIQTVHRTDILSKLREK